MRYCTLCLRTCNASQQSSVQFPQLSAPARHPWSTTTHSASTGTSAESKFWVAHGHLRGDNSWVAHQYGAQSTQLANTHLQTRLQNTTEAHTALCTNISRRAWTPYRCPNFASRMDALEGYQYGSQSIPLFSTYPQTRLQNQYGGLASLSAKHFPQKFLDEDALNPSFSRYSCRNFSMKTALRASFHLVPGK